MSLGSLLLVGTVIGLLLCVVYLAGPAPRPQPHDVWMGKASWYGDELRGSRMANGQPFNPDRLTCAARLWPLGTHLRVTHGTRSVVVTVTDRGPSKKHPDRIVDLSRAAFACLADPDVGVIEVTVTQVP